MADIKGDVELAKLEKQLKKEQFKLNILSAKYRIAQIQREIEICNNNIAAWEETIATIEKEI